MFIKNFSLTLFVYYFMEVSNENKDVVIAIVGSRGFIDYDYFERLVLDIIIKEQFNVIKIVSGGANGVDTLAEQFANNHVIEIEVIKPDWSKGKIAGPLRNTEIVNKSDVVIAFWDGVSKGTQDSIKKAKESDKRLFTQLVTTPNNMFVGTKPIDGAALEALNLAIDKSKKSEPTLPNRK